MKTQLNQKFIEFKNGQTVALRGLIGKRIIENYKGFLILLEGGNGWCSIYAHKPINGNPVFAAHNIIKGTICYAIGSSDCAMHCRKWCDKLLRKHKMGTDIIYKIDNSEFLHFTEHKLY